jgi:hypothetical protein
MPEPTPILAPGPPPAPGPQPIPVTEPGQTELDISERNRPPTMQEARVALEQVSNAIRTSNSRGGYIYVLNV